MKIPRYLLGPAVAHVLGVSGSMAMRFQPVDPLAGVRVARSYRAPDFGSIDLEGVCQVTPESVACWDEAGKPDSGLTTSFKSYLTANPNCVLCVALDKKCRIALFRKQGVSLPQPDAEFATFGRPQASLGQGLIPIGATGSGGQSSFMSQEPHPEDPAPEELRYEVVDSPGSKTETILFPLKVTLGHARLALQIGSNGQIGPIGVRITDIRKATPEDVRLRPRPMRKESAWIVSIELSGYPALPVPLVHGYPLDAKGEEIRLVEASGKPIPQHSTRGTYFEGPHPRPTYIAALDSFLGRMPSEQRIWLFADPRKVAALSLTAGGTRKVEITDIPLDPVDPQ